MGEGSPEGSQEASCARHAQPREASWRASPGTPHSVSWLESSEIACGDVFDAHLHAVVPASGQRRLEDDRDVFDDEAEARRFARRGLEVEDGLGVAGRTGTRRDRTRRRSTTPTAVAAGQRLTPRLGSSSNCARVQRGVALGSPSRPGGSLKCRSRGSAGAEGQPPPCSPCLRPAPGFALPGSGSRRWLRFSVVVSWKGCEPACGLRFAGFVFGGQLIRFHAERDRFVGAGGAVGGARARAAAVARGERAPVRRRGFPRLRSRRCSGAAADGSAGRSVSVTITSGSLCPPPDAGTVRRDRPG